MKHPMLKDANNMEEHLVFLDTYHKEKDKQEWRLRGMLEKTPKMDVSPETLGWEHCYNVNTQQAFDNGDTFDVCVSNLVGHVMEQEKSILDCAWGHFVSEGRLLYFIVVKTD